MSCRYSNGAVVSYVARATAHDENSIRVLCSESFEKGVRLNVLAPFWSGITACRVIAVARSREQTAYFELELRLIPKPKPVPQDHKAPDAVAAASLLDARVAAATSGFANLLEQHSHKRLSFILAEQSPEERLLVLPMMSAVVALLLQEKQMLDLRHLAATLERSATND